MAGSENDNNVTQVYLLGKTYLANNQGQFYIRNDPIIFMAAGDRHTIIITESGRAFAFGDNGYGQLGLGHTNPVEKVSCIKSLKFENGNERLQMAACGRDASLVATNTGALYAFGSNSNSQLGFESSSVQSQPTKIQQLEGHKWKQIAMGAEHACALTLDGQVFVWGSNEDGQCGLPRRIDVIKIPQELSMSKTITAISCGYYHTAFIDDNNDLYVCGNNSGHQLGQMKPSNNNDPMQISFPDKVQAVSCGNQHTVVLLRNGQVYACGDGSRGQLGLGERIQSAEHFELIEKISKRVTSIAAGEGHTAIVGARGDLFICGDGKHGKLGSTTYSNEFDACVVEKFKGYQVLQVACGGCQTIILARKRVDDEKKSSASDEDISNATLSVTQRPKSRARVVRNKSITERSHNVTDSMDATMRSVKPIEPSNYLRVEPDPGSNNEDSDNELSASMKSATFNQTHTLTNGKLRPTQSSSMNRTNQLRSSGQELKPIRTGILDRTARLNPETGLSPRTGSRSPLPERTVDEHQLKEKPKDNDSTSDEDFRDQNKKGATTVPTVSHPRFDEGPTRAKQQQQKNKKLKDKDSTSDEEFRDPIKKGATTVPAVSHPRFDENPTRAKQKQQNSSSDSETPQVRTSSREPPRKTREEGNSDDVKPKYSPVLRRLEPPRSPKNPRRASPSPRRRNDTFEDTALKRPLPKIRTSKQRKQSSDSTQSSDNDNDSNEDSEDNDKGKKPSNVKAASKDPPQVASRGSDPTGKKKNDRDGNETNSGKASDSSRDKNNKNEDKGASKSDTASSPGFFARIFSSKTPATPKETETTTPTNNANSSNSRTCVVM